MKKDENSSYEILKMWLGASMVIIWKFSPELISNNSPLNKIGEFEKSNFATAKRSLYLGIADTVSATQRYSVEDIKVIDSEFSRLGLPTLSSIRILFSKKIAKIFSSGIKSDIDYEIIKNIDSSDLPDFILDDISKMIIDYEFEKFK